LGRAKTRGRTLGPILSLLGRTPKCVGCLTKCRKPLLTMMVGLARRGRGTWRSVLARQVALGWHWRICLVSSTPARRPPTRLGGGRGAALWRGRLRLRVPSADQTRTSCACQLIAWFVRGRGTRAPLSTGGRSWVRGSLARRCPTVALFPLGHQSRWACAWGIPTRNGTCRLTWGWRGPGVDSGRRDCARWRGADGRGARGASSWKGPRPWQTMRPSVFVCGLMSTVIMEAGRGRLRGAFGPRVRFHSWETKRGLAPPPLVGLRAAWRCSGAGQVVFPGFSHSLLGPSPIVDAERADTVFRDPRRPSPAVTARLVGRVITDIPNRALRAKPLGPNWWGEGDPRAYLLWPSSSPQAGRGGSWGREQSTICQCGLAFRPTTRTLGRTSIVSTAVERRLAGFGWGCRRPHPSPFATRRAIDRYYSEIPSWRNPIGLGAPLAIGLPPSPRKAADDVYARGALL